jgi:hypothetical protein
MAPAAARALFTAAKLGGQPSKLEKAAQASLNAAAGIAGNANPEFRDLGCAPFDTKPGK